MIKNTAFRFKKMLEKINYYMKDDPSNIDKTNSSLLKLISVITVVCVVFFVVITPYLISGWKVTAPYIIYLLFSIVFAVYVNLLPERKAGKRPLCLINGLTYMFALMSFIIFVDTVSNSASAASFAPTFIVAAPIMFIVPFWQMLIFQLYLLIGVSVMSVHMKPAVFYQTDIFNTIFGMVVSIVVYFILMNLRVHDYTQRKKYKMLSEKDALTGISNRETSVNNIKMYLSSKNPDTPCTMMIVDVDNFKNINDSLGHENGDVVLREVGNILRSEFRKSDIFGRFGGDEFLVFLKDTDEEDLIREKCENLNSRMHQLLEGKFDIACSIGVCTLKSGTATMEELFSAADDALYEAKAFGKGIYVKHEFSPVCTNKNDLPLMLIIDDNMVDRETLAIQFEDKYRIVKIADSEEAIAYINAHTKEISIILLDMIMPEVDGFEVLRRIKSKPEMAWIPVVAISSDESAEQKALECGASDMIFKPVVPAIAKIRIANVMK